MSTKSIIQNLEDSELIRIFLQFVQAYHLQYEKIAKEISYKCHEATWILATTKATGYGRTESEAYKHALRNLLEMLIDDPPYTQFFVGMLSPSTHMQPQPRLSQNLNSKQKPGYSNNSINKQKPLYSVQSTSLAHGSEAQAVVQARQLQTQSAEIDSAEENVKLIENGKLNSSVNNGKYEGNSRYETINRTSTSSYAYPESLKVNTGYSNIPNDKSRDYKKTRSNCNMTVQVAENIGETSKNPNRVNSAALDMEVKEAILRNKKLTEELNNINRENDNLKVQLHGFMNAAQNRKRVPLPTSNENVNKPILTQSSHSTSSYLHQGSNSKIYNHLNMGISSNAPLSDVSKKAINAPMVMSTPIIDPTASMPSSGDLACEQLEGQEEHIKPRHSLNSQQHQKSKVMVPKLKLQILPNYHKKAEKSLNDSLLAVYEQKYGVSNQGLGTVNMHGQGSKKMI